MRVLSWSAGVSMFSAARMSPLWSIHAASTSLTFLFWPPKSRIPRFIRPVCAKGINGATGAGRGWSIAPSRTFLIPICTSLRSLCINDRFFFGVLDHWCGSLHPFRSNDNSLFLFALHICLRNLFRVNQPQRQVFGLSGPQPDVLLPHRKNSLSRRSKIVVVRAQL